MKSPKFEFRIILIFVLAALALMLLTIDSEGYDLPKGHMVIKTVEIEFTDSYKTILFVDKDEDYKCDYGVYLHEDLSRREIASAKMSCEDAELTINNWIESWGKKSEGVEL